MKIGCGLIKTRLINLSIFLLLLTLVQPASAALTNFQTFSGQYGAEVSAKAFAGLSSVSGSLNVSGVPGTASITAAYLYTNSWFSTPSISGNFGALSLGPSGPTGTTSNVSGYRFDITSQVTGNGSYSFNLANSQQIYGVALVVVYQDASLPLRSVIINDVADENSNGTSTMSTSFTSTAAGTGNLWLFTEADDTTTSGENILFNGIKVGGPIDNNLGQYASLFNIPVSVVNGSNTVDLTTAGDYYGWHLAVLQTSAVPVPPSIFLFVPGLIGLWGLRRKKFKSI